MKIKEWLLGLCWKWQLENDIYQFDLWATCGSSIIVHKPKFNWIKVKLSDIVLSIAGV